jgi:hypothetical protein
MSLYDDTLEILTQFIENEYVVGSTMTEVKRLVKKIEKEAFYDAELVDE